MPSRSNCLKVLVVFSSRTTPVNPFIINFWRSGKTVPLWVLLGFAELIRQLDNSQDLLKLRLAMSLIGKFTSG